MKQRDTRRPTDPLRVCMESAKVRVDLICHVNDAKRLLTILSVASRDDVYNELKSRL